MFESAMKTVDMTFQNLDSSEISLTDVSHYFDSDPTKLVQGLRGDGKMPNAYIADTTTANAQVTTVSRGGAALSQDAAIGTGGVFVGASLPGCSSGRAENQEGSSAPGHASREGANHRILQYNVTEPAAQAAACGAQPEFPEEH